MKNAASILLAALLLAPVAARANDRPFQVTRTAVAEDDAGTWSVESWVQRRGSVRGLSVEPEYGFTPFTSVQMEFTRLVDRAGAETGHEAEVEFKHLFNQIQRDGWGWGVSLALSAERSRADGTQRSMTLKLPLSIELHEGGPLLHLNAGVMKAEHERRRWNLAAGAEAEVYRRTTLFGELARTGPERYGQLGLRHWVTRERLALDFALQQRRADGQRASGFIVGLGWYDL